MFDAASEPGGTLRWGVPDYRLPKAVLAQEIDAILGLGVDLRLGVRIESDIGAEELRGLCHVAAGEGPALPLRVAMHFCPDAAVIKLGSWQGRRFDFEFCKGCGICAQDCPTGHIHMEPEPAVS